MSIEFFIINLHLAPFIILFIAGSVLLTLAPLHYGWRTKSITIYINPDSIRKYVAYEKRVLFLGMIFVLLGILGVAIISEQYGYRRVIFDSNGNKSIEWSKPERMPE